MEIVEYSSDKLTAMTERAALLESCMKEYDAVAREYRALKSELYKAMSGRKIRQWVTNGGTKITVVGEKAPETAVEREFDITSFARDFPELYEKYTREREVAKPGRSGYVKITFKEET